VIVVRYADDIVVGFEFKDEAERFLAELKERMRKFQLELHPEKTRLIESTLLLPGANHLEIRVGNLGINALAGRAPQDYRPLKSRYGVRFVPQDMQDLQPLPSGILGPVRLMAETAPYASAKFEAWRSPASPASDTSHRDQRAPTA
jgi:hypothetical protein